MESNRGDRSFDKTGGNASPNSLGQTDSWTGDKKHRQIYRVEDHCLMCEEEVGGEQRCGCLIRLESKLDIDDEGTRRGERTDQHDVTRRSTTCKYAQTREKCGTRGDQGGMVFKFS